MDNRTDDELVKTISEHKEHVPKRIRAQAELDRRIAERAGASAVHWAKVAAWAAIIGAGLTLASLVVTCSNAG
jgi:hypothetical protein